MADDPPRLEDQRDNLKDTYVIPSHALALYFARLAAKKQVVRAVGRGTHSGYAGNLQHGSRAA